MSIFYNMIHSRADKNWREPVNRENYERYAAHWLNCARAIKEDFLAEGLPETAAAIDKIIIEQSKINGL